MTAAELIEALKETGTGERKLAWARDWLHDHKTGTGEDLIAAVGRLPRDLCPWPEGTMKKALRLIQGIPPDHVEFQGVPPPQGKEASEERLARILAGEIGRVVEAIGERSTAGHAFAEAHNIGAPQKPAGSKPAGK